MKNTPLLLLFTAWLLAGCTKQNPPTPPPPEVRAPVAEVLRVVESSEARARLPLDGRSSWDPNNLPLRYRWHIASGPGSALIEDTTAALTVFTRFVPGIYQVVLTVTNAAGKLARDTSTITILKNKAPVAMAGDDQRIYWPETESVLDGSQSIDLHDDIVRYRWRWISGPRQYNIRDSTQARTKISLKDTGSYRFELEATDALGAIGKDTVQVELKGPSYGNGEVILYNQEVVCPWGCNVCISDIRSLLPAGDTVKKVFIRKHGTTPWTEASRNLEDDPSFEISDFKDLCVWIWNETIFGYRVDVRITY